MTALSPRMASLSGTLNQPGCIPTYRRIPPYSSRPRTRPSIAPLTLRQFPRSVSARIQPPILQCAKPFLLAPPTVLPASIISLPTPRLEGPPAKVRSPFRGSGTRLPSTQRLLSFLLACIPPPPAHASYHLPRSLRTCKAFKLEFPGELDTRSPFAVL